ncbi:MAG: MazF family transcriptional regulator [Acidobacteria bacterium]|nr:MazF family transcriptional regulator [Acidobacteriota bacterium]
MTCSRNDVVLLPIPFTDLTSHKVRPAIVVGRNGIDFFLVPVSSVLSNTDFLLQEWQGAGLNAPSGVKAQLATVEERLVVKIIGTVTAVDRQSLDERLRTWLRF